MTTNLKRTTIFLTPQQHESLRKLAFEKHTSMAELVREAIIEILENEEDVHEGLKALADKEETLSWEEYKRQRAAR